MKKLILTLIALTFCSLIVAQESPTIKISASVIHKDTSPLYKATIVLGSGYSSLPSEVMTLESLKERYKKELETAGFPFTELKENPNDFGYETLGHKKDGVIYEYTTNSISSMRKFMQIRPLGVESIYVVSLIKINAEESQELVKLAIKQAKEKGLAIAGAMSKKLGDIVYMEDTINRWSDTIETSVYYDRPANEYRYNLDITFAIK